MDMLGALQRLHSELTVTNRYLLFELSFLCMFLLSMMTVKIAGPVK